MAKTTNIHVVPRNDGWIVRKEGTSRPTSAHQTQRDAVEAARKIARNQSGELVIHGRDGRIRDRDSYGADPMPPRDREVLFPNKSASASEKATKMPSAQSSRNRRLAQRAHHVLPGISDVN